MQNLLFLFLIRISIMYEDVIKIWLMYFTCLAARGKRGLVMHHRPIWQTIEWVINTYNFCGPFIRYACEDCYFFSNPGWPFSILLVKKVDLRVYSLSMDCHTLQCNSKWLDGDKGYTKYERVHFC